jgi:hypothetical protein
VAHRQCGAQPDPSRKAYLRRAVLVHHRLVVFNLIPPSSGDKSVILLHYPDGRPVSLEDCVVTLIEPARNGGTLIWVGSEDDSLAIHAREDYSVVQAALRQRQLDIPELCSGPPVS